MAHVQLTDLLVVGRNGASYQVPFSDLKLSVTDGNTIVFPDVTDPGSQAGTLDDRYVLAGGDVMTGALQLPTADPTGNFDATHKTYVDAADAILAADIAANTTLLLVTKYQVELLLILISTVRLNNEIARAEGAEADLDKKIDDLILDNLADVAVAGASNGQVVSWDDAGQQWVAKTVTLSSSLDYSGSIDLTASAPTANAGELFANTGVGAVDASFGVGVTGPLPTAAGGELVAYNGTAWQYVGSVGGGLTYTSFNARNIHWSREQWW